MSDHAHGRALDLVIPADAPQWQRDIVLNLRQNGKTETTDQMLRRSLARLMSWDLYVLNAFEARFGRKPKPMREILYRHRRRRGLL